MEIPPRDSQLINVFRNLLIAEILLCVIGLLLGIAESAYLPQPESSAESSVLDGLTLGVGAILLFLCLPALITAWIGLFSFRSWARRLYIILQVVVICLTLPISLFHVSLDWGFTHDLSGIASTISGAIIAIMYLTPIAKLFDPNYGRSVTGIPEV